VPRLYIGDMHGRQSFGGQQGIDCAEVGVQRNGALPYLT
jgi:hypothetical protein